MIAGSSGFLSQEDTVLSADTEAACTPEPLAIWSGAKDKRKGPELAQLCREGRTREKRESLAQPSPGKGASGASQC